MKDTVVVYMDTKERCRVQVNPANLSQFEGMDNVVMNPPIAELLERGITPDMWYVVDGAIHTRAKKLEVDVSMIELYDMFLTVADIKEEMEVWLATAKKSVHSIMYKLGMRVGAVFSAGILLGWLINV